MSSLWEDVCHILCVEPSFEGSLAAPPPPPPRGTKQPQVPEESPAASTSHFSLLSASVIIRLRVSISMLQVFLLSLQERKTRCQIWRKKKGSLGQMKDGGEGGGEEGGICGCRESSWELPCSGRLIEGLCGSRLRAVTPMRSPFAALCRLCAES